MDDAAQVDIPPESMSSETSKCQEESISGQIHEIGTVSQCSVPTKEDIGCDAVQNELQEVCRASKNAGEQSQSFSKNVAEHLRLEQLGVPQAVSKSSQSSAGNVFTLSTEGGHSSSHQIDHELIQTVMATCSGTVNDQLQSFSGIPELEQFGPSPKYESGAGNVITKPSTRVHHSSLGQVGDEPLQTASITSTTSTTDQLQSFSVTENSLTEPLEMPHLDSQTDKPSCSGQRLLEQINGSGFGTSSSEAADRNEKAKSSAVVSSSIVFEQLRPASEAVIEDFPIGYLEPPLEDASKSPSDKQVDSVPEDVTQNYNSELLETPTNSAKGRQHPKSRKKDKLRSSIGSDRVLRSREKPKDDKSTHNVANIESSNSVANISNEKEKKRKKGKKRQHNRVIADEFSRIRTHLRYLLNRISYEKSLIDAYSGEGWKGSSLEKLKPEKELQRANSEILRRKLKIRDLFQRLHSLCAEGMFPESLFDSEGQIDSEDIYCAKCGSKDVSLVNDIILCDGACDRGFHQFCLEPPLLSDDIPPDDEGWLCPGCDCKVDCIDLLNDSQGTDLSVTDSWEKVFPEAAVAASAGQNQEHGLPSDDSDDNDYDPDVPDTEERVQEEESNSDDSEYASVSDGSEAPKSNDDQFLGLPSDDSEDDDYDPDAPVVHEDVKQESSSSDFISDSEDLGAALDDNVSSDDVGFKSMPMDGCKLLRRSGKQHSGQGKKRHSLKDELSSLLESGPGEGTSAPVSGKRHIEKLDYKKLHDETYANVPTDSSDEEEWSDTATPRKRKSGTRRVATRNTSNIKDDLDENVHTPRRTPRRDSKVTYANVPTDSSDEEEWSDTVTPRKRKNGTRRVATRNTSNIKDDLDENVHTPRRTPRRDAKVEDTNNSLNKSPKGSTRSGSNSRRVGLTHRRLGEAVTQQLYKSFKENHYPDRAMKESLARELGLMAKQVSKWFENARHCLKVGVDKNASENGTPLPQTNQKQLEQEDTIIGDSSKDGARNKEIAGTDVPMAGCSSGDVKDSELVTPESSRKKSVTPKGRKRKLRSDDLDPNPPEPLAEPETNRKATRVTTRRRKSVA